MLNYNDDNYSQGYSQIKKAFMALTKNDIFRPYISERNFRSTNNGDDICYSLYLFDIRYQKNLESAQPIKVKFKFSANIPAGIYGYAWLTKAQMVKVILIWSKWHL